MAALPLVWAPVSASAVVLLSGDPNRNTTAPGDDLAGSGWQYQFNFSSFLGTPVGPNHFLTAAHVGDGMGSSFTYNGVSYTIVPFSEQTPYHDFGDLRLYQVDNTFYSYAPLYDATVDGLEKDSNLVVFGRGRTRGSEVRLPQNTGTLKGWEWGSLDGQMRWGTNTVTDIVNYLAPGDQRLIQVNFDNNGNPNEAHLAQNDSGGAVFIKVGDEWKLAAINLGVSGPYSYTEDGETFHASLFDTGGFWNRAGSTAKLISDTPADKPSSWYASRVSPVLNDLKSLLNLPPTWNLNADGSWHSASNWANGGVPNGVGAIADFRTVIGASRTISGGGVVVGTINFDSAHPYVIQSGVTLDVASGSARVNVASGQHTVSGQLSLNDPAVFNVIPPSGKLTVNGVVAGGSHSVTKEGAGTLEVRALRAGDVAINGGDVRVQPSALTNSGTSKVTSVTVAGGSKLDLTHNNLIVDHGGASQIGSWNGSSYTGLTGLLASGYNEGAWNGSGIVSSAAATTNGYTTLGIAEASEVLGLSGSETALWHGQTVDATSTLIKYTYAGDANLDGMINIDDYGQIDFNVGLSGNVFGYFNGDFNYDGLINIDDYGIIDFNIGIQGPPLDPSATSMVTTSGVSAVPEPAGAMIILFGAGALALRRRRRV